MVTTGNRERAPAVLRTTNAELHAQNQALVSMRERCFARVGTRLFEPGLALEPERYRILELVGMGGMGVVVSAWDSVLDRRVAIKKLDCVTADGATSISRGLREATVLASLAHPNVVAVYDVFTSDTEVSIVMELIAGQTLHAWLRSEQREIHEIVSVFEQASQGLAAAHRVGVVHRDFKPSNVIIGDDGRVRVLDFGIAHLVSSESESRGGETMDGSANTTSAFAGTRRYAAPEQHRGQAVPVTDQFSLCVSLYEAVCGEHPFEGDDASTLRRRSPPRAWRAAPRRLQQAMSRGLALNPNSRWPSMDALVSQLLPRRGTAAPWGIVVGAGLMMATGVMIPDADPCAQVATSAADVWNPSRRAEIGQAFAASPLPHAPPTWDRVETRVDTWLESWHGAAAGACQMVGTNVGHRASVQMDCLADGLEHLDAYLHVLEDARAPVIDSAVMVVGRLPDPQRCGAPPSAPARQPAGGPSWNSSALHQARMHLELGDPRTALSIANHAVEWARRDGDELSVVDLLIVIGSSHERLGEAEQAITTLGEARVLAAGAADDRRWLRAGLALVRATRDSGKYEMARQELTTAIAIAQRLPPDDPMQARVLSDRGIMARLDGDPHAALEHDRAAAAAYEEHGDRQAHAAALANASIALMELGQHDEALAILVEATESTEHELGPWHPDMAGFLLNLANAHHRVKHGPEARAMYHRALAVVDASYVKQPELIATIEMNLAMTFDAELEELSWRTHLARAKLVLEQMPRPSPMWLSNVLINYSSMLVRVRGYAEALEVIEQARRLMQGSGLSRPEFTAAIALTRGRSLLELGRAEEAVAELKPAHASAREALGREHSKSRCIALALARASNATGNHEHALALGDELVTWETMNGEPEPLRLAKTRLAYARALTATGARAEARAQCEQALALLEGLDQTRSREEFELQFELRELLHDLSMLAPP